ncbi:efflux RND transporter periplasmic adaptor subunit [soil metagenome]
MAYLCNSLFKSKRILGTILVASAVPLLFLQGCMQTLEKSDSQIKTPEVSKSTATTDSKAVAEGATEEHHVNLPTMVVRRTVVPSTIDFPGKVSALPDHSVSVSPDIVGKIAQIMVIPGQFVRKGQLVATLNDRQLQAQIILAKAPQKVALNAVAQAKISLDLADKNLARSEALFEKDILAQKDVVTAKSQSQLAKAQVEAAEAKVAETMVAPVNLNTQLAFTRVYSPINGVVAHRYLNVGSAADPNTPIVHIVDLSQVMVNASMPADSSVNPHKGQIANITTVAEPGIKYLGKIESISPMVDQASNTISIEILTSNDHNRLKEGQQVKVSISTASAQAVLVPESALVPGHDDPSEYFVYVVRNGKLNLKKVSTGQKLGNKIPVVGGISDGDEIITSGGYGVPEGSILDREAP